MQKENNNFMNTPFQNELNMNNNQNNFMNTPYQPEPRNNFTEQKNNTKKTNQKEQKNGKKEPKSQKKNTSASGASRIDEYIKDSLDKDNKPDFGKMTFKEVADYFKTHETKIGKNSGYECKVPVDAESAQTWVNTPLKTIILSFQGLFNEQIF